MLDYLDMKVHVEQMIESVGELAEGKTHHLNHIGCSAGVDKKRRFYITVKHGDFLCYCQHCGHGGLYSNGKERRFSRAETEGTVSTVKEAHFQWSNGSTIESWSDAQKLWWYSHEMDDNDAHDYDVRAYNNSLYIFSSTHLYIARNFQRGAKYVRSQTRASTGFVQMHRPDGPLFIVEDVLSCYKLFKARHACIALLGTKLSTAAKEYVATQQSKGVEVVLWLDDDIAGRSGAKVLYKELSPMGVVKVVKGMLEPKQTPLSVLRSHTYMKGVVHE